MAADPSIPVVAEEAARRGDDLYDEENYVDAMRWYRVAADQGHASSRFYIAWLYFYGLGVEQNLDQASAWLALAAENGESGSVASMRAAIERQRRETRANEPRRTEGKIADGRR